MEDYKMNRIKAILLSLIVMSMFTGCSAQRNHDKTVEDKNTSTHTTAPKETSNTGNNGNSVGGAAEDVGNGAGNAVKDVGEGVGNAAEGIGEGAEDVIEGAGDAVGDVFDGGDDNNNNR